MQLSVILIALFVFLLAGVSKGISGMGLPLVATPILTVMFDLQTAIALTVPATVATDCFMLVKTFEKWSTLKKAAVLTLMGIGGMIIGSTILVMTDSNLLTGLLGVVIIFFVISSLTSFLPQFTKPPQWVDGAVGLIGGTLQGAAGASGPLISLYFLQMNVSRYQFLFLINCYFVVIDITQLITISSLGFYQGNTLFLYALLAIIPSFLGLALAMKIQKSITDSVFKYSVLSLIGISGLLLLYKALFS
ncbi:sulfite exporter TauE/SafE family protein [Halalkalibacter oceani]|uniref:Probable membrane transporter protein n=1 Tax=Halalkalibacter oceani TaxID=1653776 RepID=A0A9X2IPK0_9BACI|nr:sulfite exporter TauE/SafE family protein [Halalkalibacter oceani]MCM3715325.1 sulfite exporter TauE/SafE family protein [Halalkalibacter oceani]